MSDCGCRVKFGLKQDGGGIVYCPMHKAAPQMREALQEVLRQIALWPLCDLSASRDVERVVRDALKED